MDSIDDPRMPRHYRRAAHALRAHFDVVRVALDLCVAAQGTWRVAVHFGKGCYGYSYFSELDCADMTFERWLANFFLARDQATFCVRPRPR